MKNFGKWIGGGLGWALGGPLGALVGFSVGAIFDKSEVNIAGGAESTGAGYRHRTGAGDFGMSLLVLSAAVMKADGRVMKSELEFVRKFFLVQFGEVKTVEFMRVFKDLLGKDVPLTAVCEQIRFNMKHPLRLQMLHYLFGISQADGHIHPKEVEVIASIARYLGISSKDFESIKAMFTKDAESAYKILELETNATDAGIKKAYRKMALKYHPDKVAQLGEDVQKAAKEKFQKVQEAYEIIKKERGIN